MRLGHLYRLLFLGLCLALLLTYAPSLVQAGGLNVTPSHGGTGTTFEFSGSGFSPNERIAIWLNYPDGRIIGQGYVQADGNGAATFSVMPDTTYPFGSYSQVAHGMSTGYEILAWFDFDAPNQKPTGGGGGGGGGSSSNSCGSGFSASGFAAGELVATWTTHPDGVSTALPNATADSSGLVTFDFSPQAGWPTGDYIVVAHGYTSQFEAINHMSWDGVNVRNADCHGAPPPPPPPPPSSSGSNSCGGGSGNYSATGFIPGELVSTWTTRPDGVSVGLPAVSADGSGVVTFSFMPQPGWPAGDYVVVARGYSSHLEVPLRFGWDGATLSGGCGGPVQNKPIVPSNIVEYRGPGVYLGSPDALYYFDCSWKWRPMGDALSFLVLGFKPFEQVQVSYQVMVTQPDPTHYATIQADGNGNAAFSVNTTGWSRGHYHWQFQGSSASYCGHYDLQ